MAKLLLIEDDERIQKFLTRVLAKSRHEVLSVGDGPTGIEKARDASIDMLLVDLMLPGTPSGLDLVRELRALRPDCPIVVVSGHPSPERIEELKGMGVADFLSKPFEMGFVSEIVGRVLGARDRGNGSAEG